MAKNKIITSQGNVQFINSKGKTINLHPMHCYYVVENDTISFLFIYMKDYSGQAFFASQFEDLEVNGETYDNIDDLKDAINYAFAKAGAQARTEIVDELPEDPFTNTIYLLPKEHGEGYDEYIWNEDEGWQLIGDTDIEFERYLKIDDFNPYSAATKDYIDAVSANTIQNASDIVALSGAIDTEISGRTDADAALSGAIDTVSADLASEAQRAQNAEAQLQNNINTVNGRVDAEQIARANADNALSGAVDAVDSKVDTLSGEVQTMGDEAVVDAAYVSSATTIEFYNADGDVVASIDATDFIKDGMIEDVRIENGYLIIDFNTASGTEDIEIPLTDIFNPDNYYDKDAIDEIVSGLNDSIDTKLAISDFETYSGATDAAIASKFDASAITAYSTSAEVTAEIEAATSGKVSTSDFNIYSASVETALEGKADASDVYDKSDIDAALSGKADTATTYTKTEVDNAITAATNDMATQTWVGQQGYLTQHQDISGKQDVSGMTAYTTTATTNTLSGTVTAHTADTTIHVTTAQTAAWDAKSDFSGSYNDLTNKLSAGTNITIVDNVISATGGGSIDVDNALSPTSENPVQNKVLFDELRITESEGSETKLIWEEVGYNDYRTTNFPSGYTTIKVVVKDGQTVGFGFYNSNNVSLGTYEIVNISELEVTNSFDGSTYTVDGNNVTITWDASKDVVALDTGGGGEVHDYMAEFYAVDEPVYSTLKEVVSGKVDTTDFNTYSGTVETRLTEDEEVTAAGLNALNDKFGGLKLMKISQSDYDNLQVKDNNTLYIISD